MARPADDDPLLGVASSISDGTPVDWDDVRRRFDRPIDVDVIEQLRVLDGIAHLHRTTWGSLELVEPIGHGSFGTVYRAFDTNLLREVALKVTRPRPGATPFDPERLVGEARLLARVRHPNVVSVFSAERTGNEVGVAMERITGHTLDAIVQERGALPPEEVTRIGIDMCRALAAVHAAGLLHGDIKAHNVMREQTGRIVLMDFGASRDLSRTPGEGDDFAGTPLYMAPEVFAGQPRSRASDIYSLGVLLYYLSTATYPVDGDTRSVINTQHAKAEGRRHLREVRPDLPPSFVNVIERALANDPAARFADAARFEAALEALRVTTPPSSPRMRLLVTAIVVVGIALIGGTLARISNRSQTTTPAVARGVAAADRTLASPGAVAAMAPYDIEAAMYRLDDLGPVRLAPGERLAPGDRLYLEVQASVPAHVYVVNEDDHGNAFLLFPLPGYQASNPLPASMRHRLPGAMAGEPRYWQVTSVGGREHFVIFASPTPLTEFEKAFTALPLASENQPVVSAPIGGAALETLRGVGGIAQAPLTRRNGPLHGQFSTPLPQGLESTRGPWIREVTFSNPG